MSHQKLKYPRNGSIHEKLVVVKDPRDLTDSKGGGRISVQHKGS